MTYGYTHDEYQVALKVLGSLHIYCSSVPEVRAHNCKVDDVIGLVCDEIDIKRSNEENKNVWGDKEDDFAPLTDDDKRERQDEIESHQTPFVEPREY